MIIAAVGLCFVQLSLLHVSHNSGLFKHDKCLKLGGKKKLCIVLISDPIELLVWVIIHMGNNHCSIIIKYIKSNM